MNLFQNRAGNLAIMAAIVLPVMLGTAGVALDVTRALSVKNKLQVVADAAALATASEMADRDMTEAEAVAYAKSYFAGQAQQIDAPAQETPAQTEARNAAIKDSLSVHTSATSGSGTARSFTVDVTLNKDIAMSGFSSVLGLGSMKVSVRSSSQSGREGNALSMYLALDESGSMKDPTTTINPAFPTTVQAYYCNFFLTCYRTVDNYLSKMESLKAAAAGMFLELTKADPKAELIRVGATSYDDVTKAETPMTWGTAKVAAYVTALPAIPAGGTDASGAMTNAINALKKLNANEATQHLKKGNAVFERFIVLMTDGEMTGDSANWNSALDTKVRSLCKQAKDDGIKVYTIAFMAPTKGKELLSNCASGEEYYYNPQNMTSLVQSFGDIARKAAKTGTRLTS